MRNYQEMQKAEPKANQYRALFQVSEAIATHRDLHELFQDLAQRLPRVVLVHFVALSLYDPERNVMRLHTLQTNVPADIVGGHEEPIDETPAGLVWQTQQSLNTPDLFEERRWPPAPNPARPLRAAERHHIMRALQATKWVLGGPSGAAAALGMKRTTLQSKMRKLQISRPR
ncbi:MAG: Sigma-54 dependent transcriptional regulator (Modular protein) [Nitrospira sp.]|jgi:transcriptional regulator with GAF, ATPase, and Fis domain|nr:Sigma-54 dependent transcriptional regulator (Modular protein) [Nitrospira sp.]